MRENSGNIRFILLTISITWMILVSGVDSARNFVVLITQVNSCKQGLDAAVGDFSIEQKFYRPCIGSRLVMIVTGKSSSLRYHDFKSFLEKVMATSG